MPNVTTASSALPTVLTSLMASPSANVRSFLTPLSPSLSSSLSASSLSPSLSAAATARPRQPPPSPPRHHRHHHHLPPPSPHRQHHHHAHHHLRHQLHPRQQPTVTLVPLEPPEAAAPWPRPDHLAGDNLRTIYHPQAQWAPSSAVTPLQQRHLNVTNQLQLGQLVQQSEEDRTCRVCGDRAVYVNYGALTCDSCKTFFRRQNLQPKSLSCNYTNNCHINIRTRKDCTKCRLQKCFDVGMRSEVIGSATSERQRKEMFVELVRMREELNPGTSGASQDGEIGHGRAVADGKSPMFGVGSNSSWSSSSSDELYIDLTRLKDKEEKAPQLDGVTDGSLAVVPFDAGSGCSREPEIVVVDMTDEDGGVVEPGSLTQTMVTKAIEEPASPFSFVSTGFVYTRQLSDDERSHFAEVLDIAKGFYRVPFEVKEPVATDGRSRPLHEALRFQLFGVNKMISSMNNLPAFVELDTSTRSWLMKSSCSEMLILRSAMHYDPSANSFCIDALKPPQRVADEMAMVDGHERAAACLSVDAIMMSNVGQAAAQFFSDYRLFFSLMDISWTRDDMLITLLLIVILFQPTHESPSPQAQRLARYQSRVYQKLLLRYLETTSDSYEEANRAYTQLMAVRAQLRKLREAFESVQLVMSSGELHQVRQFMSTVADSGLSSQVPAI